MLILRGSSIYRKTSLPKYARSEQPNPHPVASEAVPPRAWDTPPCLGCDRTQ